MSDIAADTVLRDSQVVFTNKYQQNDIEAQGIPTAETFPTAEIIDIDED